MEPLAAAPVVREFALRLPVDAEMVVERLADEGFLAGVALDRATRDGRSDGLLVAVTERRTRARDRRLRRRLRKGGALMIEDLVPAPPAGGEPPARPCSDATPSPPCSSCPSRGAGRGSCARPGSPSVPSRSSSPTPTAASSPVQLAEVSERDLVGHFTRLSHRQFSVDLGAYPLGSCTMKYNPKVCDAVAALPGLADVHPAAPANCIQGWLELLVELEEALCEITGMAAATLQPAAGAAGELTGLLLMRAWHEAQG